MSFSLLLMFVFLPPAAKPAARAPSEGPSGHLEGFLT